VVRIMVTSAVLLAMARKLRVVRSPIASTRSPDVTRTSVLVPATAGGVARKPWVSVASVNDPTISPASLMPKALVAEAPGTLSGLIGQARQGTGCACGWPGGALAFRVALAAVTPRRGRVVVDADGPARPRHDSVRAAEEPIRTRRRRTRVGRGWGSTSIRGSLDPRGCSG
jgi:hypothetical protein